MSDDDIFSSDQVSEYDDTDDDENYNLLYLYIISL